MIKIYKSKNNFENEKLSEKEKKSRMKELQALIVENDPYARTDDIYLIRWLSCRDWDVQAAYRRRMKYYNFRKLHADWYPRKDITEHEKMLQREYGFMLDGRDKNGRRVYLARASRINLHEHTFDEKIALDNLWFDMVCEELETIKNGVTVVIDMKDIAWSTIKWALNSQNMKLCSRYCGFVPLRYVEIHLINTSKIANLIISLCFPFLSDGLKERIHFHKSNLESLHKFVGKDVLPMEYGGDKDPDMKGIYRKLYEHFKCTPKNKNWYNNVGKEPYRVRSFDRVENRMG
ncbi:alpha-tocopherol transfer protein-like [Culicoides brevitarsis]|uniref:alpha-tocopherol transfer protein-like n=1 Tax=Culicoides brevitarsis TaxID=469753 RepID=UPI00307C7AD6